jgi:hypothetical protein
MRFQLFRIPADVDDELHMAIKCSKWLKRQQLKPQWCRWRESDKVRKCFVRMQSRRTPGSECRSEEVLETRWCHVMDISRFRTRKCTATLYSKRQYTESWRRWKKISAICFSWCRRSDKSGCHASFERTAGNILDSLQHQWLLQQWSLLSSKWPGRATNDD